MNHGIEQPLAPPLGVLTVARILGNIGDHTGVENVLPIARGIKASIEVKISTLQVDTHLFGHLFQGFQALR